MGRSIVVAPADVDGGVYDGSCDVLEAEGSVLTGGGVDRSSGILGGVMSPGPIVPLGGVGRLRGSSLLRLLIVRLPASRVWS
jgi:hypothetical protein